MPFKMIALRTLYHPDDRRDYKAGQGFTVKSEKERDRLVRALRARVDETKPTGIKTMKRPDAAAEPAPAPAPEPAPDIVQKVETAAPEALPNPFPSTEPVAPSQRPARYRRADMKAED